MKPQLVSLSELQISRKTTFYKHYLQLPAFKFILIAVTYKPKLLTKKRMIIDEEMRHEWLTYRVTGLFGSKLLISQKNFNFLFSFYQILVER